MISSRSNATIKSIRELRRRKERDQTKRYWIEGIRLVTVAAEVPAQIECVVLAPELLVSEKGLETVAWLRTRGLPVLEVTPEVFRSISSRDGPQGPWSLPGAAAARRICGTASRPGTASGSAIGRAGLTSASYGAMSGAGRPKRPNGDGSVTGLPPAPTVLRSGETWIP